MIDAGSEGSRLYLFRWEPSREPDAGMVIPEGIGSLAVQPGIASFALQPSRAGDSLAPLLDYAERLLRSVKGSWPTVPLYLRATAGMRLLKADEREAILAVVRERLARAPFWFKDDFAVVTTGQEEGVYGWLTVNHRTGNLQPGRPISFETTVGSLDLGGASTQIVFIPEKSIMAHAFPLKLGSQYFRVYSWSFLHFGLKEAAHRTSGILISEALLRVQSVSELHHPCFSLGYSYKPRFTYSDNRTFPLDVSMQGSSNFDKCEGLIRKIFNKDAPCLVQTCSFYGVYQPHVYNSRFMAFAHFSQVADYLALPQSPRIFDLKVATQYVCSLSRRQLNIMFGARVVDDFDRLHLCFHAAYIYVLLTYGYGFSDDATNILFRSRFDDGDDMNYVVGAMIYEINQDPQLLLNETQAKALQARSPASAPPPAKQGASPGASVAGPAGARAAHLWA